jgi:hypothetical protein
MQLEHLTDEEIQDYLDGNLSSETTLQVDEHLQVCRRCRETLKHYQSLYVGLEDDTGFELSKGFAKAVIRRLPAQEEAKSHAGVFNVLLMVLGVAVSLGVTLYLIDLKPLGKALSDLLPGPELGTGLLDLAEGLLVELNGNVEFLAIALLIFFLVAGLDRLVFQPRYRRLRA